MHLNRVISVVAAQTALGLYIVTACSLGRNWVAYTQKTWQDPPENRPTTLITIYSIQKQLQFDDIVKWPYFMRCVIQRKVIKLRTTKQYTYSTLWRF